MELSVETPELWNVLAAIEALIPGCFLPQISILLFATLYILCHIFLTRFKKPAEFTTGTPDFPASSQRLPWGWPQECVPVHSGEGQVTAGLGCSLCLLSPCSSHRAEGVVSRTSRWNVSSFWLGFLLLNYFICICF